ncbi:MAG: glycosyltransferase family 4 protein [Candidatus Omnitrophica bacterium]|nr:glycosyltransferase family 4 protein [Candidatus Omnitrophota bacterium]MBU1853447.1 glycosyltransferase family 4 protein [Candidatus Omnitrophota bacterium]
MKTPKLAFVERSESDFISAKIANENFINFLSKYMEVDRISVAEKKDLKETFENIENDKFDYVYIDSFNFLLETFLLRDRYQLNISIIARLDSIIHQEQNNFAYLIPLIREGDMLFTPSRYSQNSYYRISDKVKIHCIPHAIDINLIQKNMNPNIKNDKIIITYLGRLADQKGVSILIESMPRIFSEVRNVQLNVIGPLSGDRITNYPQTEYVKKIKERVKELNLAEIIHFKGVQFGADKYKLLSQSVILVNPTIAAEETFGIVNIEALSCGVPVVATNWAGINEIINDKINGVLVDIECKKFKRGNFTGKSYKVNQRQLVNSIVSILQSKTLQLKLKQNALISAKDYDYRKIMPCLVDLLNKTNRGRLQKRAWGSIKTKKATDFDYLYNRDFLFFLYYFKYNLYTYSELYQKFFGSDVLSFNEPKAGRNFNIKESDKDRNRNILRVYSDYLMLRD